MTEIAAQPWPYLATVLLAALLLGRRLKLWGWGIGVEVYQPDSQAVKVRPPGKKKRRKK